MFRKPAPWIALSVLSIVSAALALRLFPAAFPILQLDLTMDREGALSAARDLAARERIGPQTFREAASFTSDSEAQTFVELEGGGKDVYAQMLREGLYAAHQWEVRHFSEGQKHEATIRFRPDGRPYGFVEQIEETAPGAGLNADEARAVAERTAATVWLVDLAPFALVEQSRESRPTGRIDHTLTYERSSPTLNEGRYRLRLVVTGDRLTEVTHFIRIPQAFSRRYEEMRSANEAIGAAGSISMAILYIIGGIGIGLFWLLRQRWVIARPAILWGVGVASLQLLASFNEFPLAWMTYDTAIPRASFLSQRVTTALAAFAGLSTLFGLSFMAAESLTRRAFGDHPQLWRVWSRDAATSTAIAGRTVAGYLLVALFFAYDVVLYLYATRWFGWWTPSDALIHPDILATYLPWLSAIANSLQAGFWEESLFRAVPIAGAALIGDRFGQRRLFIILAFVLQTIVFGAGHAPYPTQPSYARPVELMLPSIGFGLIYLRYGLLPGIILHYAFDVIWMSLPLFVSTASGIWIDRTFVVVFTFVPLWIVLAARLRSGTWRELSSEQRNRAWTPLPAHEPASAAPAPTVARPVSRWLLRVSSIAGAIGLVAWIALQPFESSVPPLEVSRTDAARIARDALISRGVTLGPEWRIMPTIDDGRSEAHEFVWKVGGPERFRALLGRYLPTPRWVVRIASFEGDVANRAEEWRVVVNHEGEAERITHQLPESRAGAALAENEARARALTEIERLFRLQPSALREVSAQPSKLASRTDWAFTFEDLTVEPIALPASEGAGATDARGEARIEVVVAGDEVARTRPFIRLPERWQREQRARQTFSQIVGLVATLIAGGALATAAITGIIAWSRRRGFTRAVLVSTLAIFVVTSLIAAANRAPAQLAALSTARPLELQIAMLIGIGLVGLILSGTMVALAAGALAHDMPKGRIITTPQAWILGGSLAAVAAAIAAVGRVGDEPGWPNVAALGTFVPLISWSLERIPAFLLRTATLLALLTMVDDFTNTWTKRRAMFGLLLIVAGAVLGVPTAALPVGQWLLAGTLTGIALLCAYVFLLRYDLSLTILLMAAAMMLTQIRDGLQTGTGSALAGSLLGATLTLATAAWIFQRMRRARDEG